jgi:triosephosphate isomerase
MSKRLAKKLVVGNWKMNPESLKEAEKLLNSVVKNLPILKKTEVIVCVPFVYLEKLKKISKKISLGAQDASFEESGPFTGEVSSLMLENLGIKYVILGHSERRALGEDNTLINKKVKEALAAGLSPILCVGENERSDHSYFETVKTQVRECTQGVSKNLISRIIFAYEPVWALSSTPNRRDATALDSAEMAVFIRKVLSDIYTPKLVADARIIYGGSVNEKDAGEFLNNGGVDGVLPGKASLTENKFIKIVKICEALKN